MGVTPSIRFFPNLSYPLYTVSTYSRYSTSERTNGRLLRSDRPCYVPLERHCSPGLWEVLVGRTDIANSLALTFWFQPISLIWLVLTNDDSGVSLSRGFTHGYFARWITRLGFQYCHLSSPLYGLKTTRYRRGSAVTPAPGGRVSHPHGLSVIMVLLACASVSKPVIL